MERQVLVNITGDVPGKAKGELLDVIGEIMGISDAATSTPRNVSGDPPSFIQILAGLIDWTLPLKTAAIVFLTQLAKRSADEVWDRKEQIAGALRDAVTRPLKRLSAAINSARRASKTNPGIVIGLPIPDPYLGTTIHFEPEDEADIAWFIAHFVAKAEAIEAALQDEISRGLDPLGRIQLHLQDDGSFIIAWTDRTELKRHNRRIP